MRHAAALIVPLLLAPALLAADAPAPDKPKSPAAVQAIARAQKDATAAEDQYKATVLGVKRAELQELKAAQAAAMKNGNLSEANAIDAEIRRVQVDAAGVSRDTLDGVRNRIVRQKTFTFFIDDKGHTSTRIMELLPGGQFGRGGGAGFVEKRWFVGGDDAHPLLVIDGEGAAVVLEMAGNLMFKGSVKPHGQWDAVVVKPAE